MREVFENYVELSLQYGFSEAKLHQYELNYRRYFPAPPASVLDIGIGLGEMLSCMRDWGYAYHGIDISPSSVAACKARGLSCEVVEDTPAFLARNEGRYALITMLDVLEHVPKNAMVGMLKAVAGALSPDGKLILQVPSSQAKESTLSRYHDITHEILFDQHALGQLLGASGFSAATFAGFEPFYSGGPKVALKKLLRSAVWAATRLERRITGNLDPAILSPALVAVARATRQSMPGPQLDVSLGGGSCL